MIIVLISLVIHNEESLETHLERYKKYFPKIVFNGRTLQETTFQNPKSNQPKVLTNQKLILNVITSLIIEEYLINSI